jgi:hypothetical protein
MLNDELRRRIVSLEEAHNRQRPLQVVLDGSGRYRGSIPEVRPKEPAASSSEPGKNPYGHPVWGAVSGVLKGSFNVEKKLAESLARGWVESHPHAGMESLETAVRDCLAELKH